MKAMYHSAYGSPDTLAMCEMPAPSFGPHDVLVRVHAAPVREDCDCLSVC